MVNIDTLVMIIEENTGFKVIDEFRGVVRMRKEDVEIEITRKEPELLVNEDEYND